MYKRWLLLFTGILLLGLVLFAVDFYEVIRIISTLQPKFLLVLIFIEVLIIFLSALKWRVVLKKSKVSMKNLVSASFVGYLVNNITPIGIAGGEPIRAYLLYKIDKNVTMATSFASVIIDLFLEIVPIFLLAIISILLILIGGIQIEIAFFLGFLTLILFVIFVIFVGMVINKEFSMRFIKFLIRVFSKIPVVNKKVISMKPKIDNMYEKFTHALRKNVTDTQILIYGTIISFVKWMLTLLRVYIIFIGLNLNVTFPQIMIAETVVIVLSGVPLLPGALGIWEGASVILFTQISGILPAQAAAGTVIDRVLFYFIPSVIGVFFAIHFGINILKSDEIERDAQLKYEIIKKKEVRRIGKKRKK